MFKKPKVIKWIGKAELLFLELFHGNDPQMKIYKIAQTDVRRFIQSAGPALMEINVYRDMLLESDQVYRPSKYMPENERIKMGTWSDTYFI